MPFSTPDILWGMVLPALVAGLAFSLLTKVLPAERAKRWSAAVSLIGGFSFGYFLSSFAVWPPTSHWHWLPVAVLPGLVFGPLSREFGLGDLLRSPLLLPPSLIAAWLLMPTWERLEPDPMLQMAAWAMLFWALMVAIEPLADRIPPITLSGVFSVVLFCGAVVVIQGETLRFGQTLLTAAFSMGGLFLANLTLGRRDHLLGIACPFVLLLGGPILVGQVSTFSGVPLASYLLVPLAPLTLWLTQVGPLAKSEGMAKMAAMFLLPTVTCLGAILLSEWIYPSLSSVE